MTRRRKHEADGEVAVATEPQLDGNGQPLPPPPPRKPVQYATYTVSATNKVTGAREIVETLINRYRWRKWWLVMERMVRQFYTDIRVVRGRDVTDVELAHVGGDS